MYILEVNAKFTHRFLSRKSSAPYTELLFLFCLRERGAQELPAAFARCSGQQKRWGTTRTHSQRASNKNGNGRQVTTTTDHASSLPGGSSKPATLRPQALSANGGLSFPPFFRDKPWERYRRCSSAKHRTGRRR